MKNLNKTLLATVLATGMTSSFAATDTIKLIGKIDKAVSVSFESSTLDLGDMTNVATAQFVVTANTDYTVSVPKGGNLENAEGTAKVPFTASVDKTNSTMSITPDAISATQAAGDYSGNVTLTVAAI